MPNVTCSGRQIEPHRLGFVGGAGKQAELNALCVRREQREVDAAVVASGAERMRFSRLRLRHAGHGPKKAVAGVAVTGRLSER
jgi:hypothetical protein